MSQIALREYDAKILFSKSQHKIYEGILINDTEQLNSLIDDGRTYVVKPDQLFGGRGNLGLIGINLTLSEVKNRILSHFNTTIVVNGVSGTLNTFLIEPFIEHTSEYFLAFTTERECDVITFSTTGGVHVENTWESTTSMAIGVLNDITIDSIASYFHITNMHIVQYIYTMFNFFRTYGFTYLEINPFVIGTDNTITHLDMVAKVDSCERYKQKNNWQHIVFSQPFGKEKSEAEEKITALDQQTGASVKLSMLNNNGSIWLVLGGGGASVITMDTLASYDMLPHIGNYGELSGNPSLEDNRIYTSVVIDQMIQSTAPKKVLCIIGGIANFTHIDVMIQGIIGAIDSYKKEFIEQGISIIVRRGGINDTQALARFGEYCAQAQIPVTIADSTVFLTKPLEQLVGLL